MPVDIEKLNGTTESHIAERLEINPLPPDEDVQKMQIKAYFYVFTYLNGEKISRFWDSEPLIFDCEGDEELEAAMRLIQARIGQKRYEQVTAPPKSIAGAVPSDS